MKATTVLAAISTLLLLALLYVYGIDLNTCNAKDITQSAALSFYNQPQTNIFLGEGGPRNFIQTTGPTINEICGIPFKGSSNCIRFTTADERAGSLSGSTESEAVTWGKYVDASPERDIVVWGDYTTTSPDVIAYVAGKIKKEHLRFIKKMSSLERALIDKVKEHKDSLEASQRELAKLLPIIQDEEMRLREKEK